MNRVKKVILFLSIYISLFTFSISLNFKEIITFKVGKITENPVFKIVEREKLYEGINKLRKIIDLMKEVNPQLIGAIVIPEKGNSYILFSGNISRKKIANELNLRDDFITFKKNSREIVFKFYRKEYKFTFYKNSTIFSKTNINTFPLTNLPLSFRDLTLSNELIVFISPELLKHPNKNGNISNLIDNWDYLAIFPGSYSPFKISILIKNKNKISAQKTKNTVEAINYLFKNYLKGKFSGNLKVEVKNSQLFTSITFALPINFRDLFQKSQ